VEWFDSTMCLYKVTMVSMLIVYHDNSTFTGENASVFALKYKE